MDTTTEAVDVHLAKFPPFKGPRIGGNFEVDENVLSALPIPGSQVEYANTYENSLWGRTAEIVCRAPDDKTVAYFHKAIKHGGQFRYIETFGGTVHGQKFEYT